ncbi:MAG TPA: LuxR C-terminal-related transcriptional regulator, partial [Ktedonobacterales bacterium]|nr:LuxR C-terminal-related transcriptional regulator [Ktedonobacterales bacterium]
AADLARHFSEASEWSKSLEYARLAGARTQALYAPRASIEQYTRALFAAQQLGEPTPQGLLLMRGQAYEMLGEFTLAQADFEGALAQAEADHDQTAEWNALVCLGMLWAGRDYEKTGDYYRQALTLAETMGDRTLLARSLNRIGNWYVNHEEPVEGQQRHHEALAIMEASGDSAGVAETCDFLGMAYLLGADLVQSADYCQRAISLYRAANQQQGLSSNLTTLGLCGLSYQCAPLTPASLPVAPQSYAEEAIRIAQTIGYRSGEAYAYFCLGCILGPQGMWGAALKAMQSSLAIAQEIEHRQWTCAALTGLNCIFDDLLDLDAARRFGEQALEIATAIGSQHWLHCAAGFLVSTSVRQGDLVRAEAVLRACGVTGTSVTTLGEHLLGRALIELLLARHAFAEALTAVDNLIAHTPNAALDHHAPTVALLRGKTLAANGRTAEAEACLQAGITSAQTLNNQTILRSLYVELGRLYRRERRHDELAQTLRKGEALTQRLAAAITDQAQREMFRARALAALPAAPAYTQRQTVKQRYGGLTLRESEVARSIAQGKSNKAIAEQFVVSERTIESHVSNILSKLGFATRTQIAAWAVAQGLIENT